VTRGEVKIDEARSLDDLAAMRAVFVSQWGEDGVPHLNVFRAVQHAGGYASIAVDERGDVIGGSIGFLGRSPDGDALLHSHITGVRSGATDGGHGFALKTHQREWCLARGIDVVEWTFDPMVRRNAHFNLVKLGAVATEFHAGFYGEMDDALNGGDETDRLVATWRLRDERVPDVDGDRLISVPDEFHELRRRDATSARAARHRLRDALQDAFGNGFVATGFTGRGEYVLRRR
jgi:predicted GNAT superfamily acetyltransferase